MTCGTCTHWQLTGDLAKHGYGICLARPIQFRGITTADWSPCRTGKFVAINQPSTSQQ